MVPSIVVRQAVTSSVVREWGTVQRASVRVWLVATNQGATTPGVDLLQEDERSECARFVNPRDRCTFAVTRVALRCLLGDEIGISPHDVRLVRNAWGKPLLAKSQYRPGFDFSVSHTGDLSVIAISSSGAVGVDIERRHRLSEMHRIAADVFDEQTASALYHLPPSNRDEAFLRLWTAGEACLKALGLGFAGAGGQAPVGLSPQGSPEIRFDRCPVAADNEKWRLHSLDLPPDYVGTLVAQNSASAAGFCAVQPNTDPPRIAPVIYQ